MLHYIWRPPSSLIYPQADEHFANVAKWLGPAAALAYGTDLNSIFLPGHDATTTDGKKRVQIKATFQN
jgi:hypothetical protein